MRRLINIFVITIALTTVLGCSGCNDEAANDGGKETLTMTTESEKPEAASAEKSVPEDAGEDTDDYTDGLGDTFSEETEPAAKDDKEAPEDDKKEEDDEGSEPENKENKDIDLIFFMGQSNMSGAGGDATLAPSVAPEAGMEFRAISDPTTLYPIKEPFGVNENNPTGLHEFPEAKKGSLVSSFINEYNRRTGRRVIAVSMSMGATDMNIWNSEGVKEDVKLRRDRTLSYLKDNGYNIGHMYVVWLHGESDAIGHTDPAVYKTCLDDVMRPMFIGGVRKVFIIAPGRTIDYKDIFKDIINVQKEICEESDYYAMATTILTKISTEYMLDQYHYNQHVLNLVGVDAAASVAYFTEHQTEKIVYDYREGKYIIPEGVDPDSQEKDHIDIYEIDINTSF